MMIRKLLTFAGTGLAILYGANAQAAVATIDFTTETTAYTTESLSYNVGGIGGINLEISSAAWTNISAVDNGSIRTEENVGIGVLFGIGDQDPAIDSAWGMDTVIFDFSEDVKLRSIAFTSFDGEDQFAFFSDPFVEGQLEHGGPLDIPPSGTFDLTSLRSLSFGDYFAIGAITGGDTFYISELTFEYAGVSAVPLPPAVLLFGAALTGLGWFTRRRKSAQV